MNEFIRYILISTICLSVLYLGYLLFQKRETRFRQLRCFLLISIFLSVMMPFSTFHIDLGFYTTKNNVQEINNHETANFQAPSNEHAIHPINPEPVSNNKWNFGTILILIYFIGLSFLGMRFLAHFIQIIYLFGSSDKIEDDRVIVLLNEKIKSPFTFLNWIFIPNNAFLESENQEILTHERIHALQYHSVDKILIELLSAVMWFNPLVWMMKKSVQLVHEYLADEGVLNTGADKLRYQALLINQVAEERLICLSSSFNHSLIKKRMNMMTKSKFNQGSKLRILALIPLATVLFIGVACVNGQNQSNVVTAVAPVKMNVLYVGVDNPIKIAASGYNASDITASVDNGTISGKNGEYVIRPERSESGSAIVTVSCKGKEIQKTTFRVKFIPDPIAGIQCKNEVKTSGNISKKELLKAQGIKVFLRNFDFDLNFEVVSFVMSAQKTGEFVVYEEISDSENYSPLQIELIKSLIENQKLMIEGIVVKGPDGKKRKLSPMVFTITG